METTLPTVEAYLVAQAKESHALAQLLQRPEKEKGVVHTPREIAQQPLLWRYTAKKMRRHAPKLNAFLKEAGLYNGQEQPTVLLIGAGTSDYVGFSIADLLRSRWGVPAANCSSTRITASPDNYLRKDRRYVMVHFARSGNSPESHAVLDFALAQRTDSARHVVITCNAEGTLAKLAREYPEQVYLIVLDEACNDQGLAMTSSYSAMVVAGQALAFLDEMEVFGKRIDTLAEAAEYVLETYTDRIFELSHPSLERAIFLGNGDLLGAATESALKIQELTAGQVMAASEDTLAFRHGPISAVNEQTLVCFFLSADAYARRYELDVLYQYQDAFLGIGAETLVVSGNPLDDRVNQEVNTIVYDPQNKWDIPVFFQVQIAGMVGQLLGLFSSYRRDLNVDTPSQDKTLYSRTVQGVRLYEYPDGNERLDGDASHKKTD